MQSKSLKGFSFIFNIHQQIKPSPPDFQGLIAWISCSGSLTLWSSWATCFLRFSTRPAELRPFFLYLGMNFTFANGSKPWKKHILKQVFIKTNLQELKKFSYSCFKNDLREFSSTLTRALTRSSCFCWKVARSTCPSSVGSRLMSSGWILSSRALTSHSCLCLALRNGFASRPSKFGSPAPVDVRKRKK